MQTSARLIFPDGSTFHGKVFAGSQDRTGEVVFNTAMAGYQEVLTDPSYSGQIVVMTYPLIGNYGIHEADWESKGLHLEALLIKEYCDFPSHFASQKTLKAYLDEHHILGLEGFDTRAITRYVRDNGAQRAWATTSDDSIEDLLNRLKSLPSMVGSNLADKVTTSQPYVWQVLPNPKFKVAVIDCGIKFNILRILTSLGCECEVFPTSVSAQTILNKGFNGVFVSNGPGDPEPLTHVVDSLKTLLGKLPVFGICLGHQLMGLAFGGKTYKLKFGHHGVNHPVKNLRTQKVEITSQNHGFCVDMATLNSEEVEVTHVNLNDHTVEGIRHKRFPAFAVQYHPEAAPGPEDPTYLFHDFIAMMKGQY